MEYITLDEAICRTYHNTEKLVKESSIDGVIVEVLEKIINNQNAILENQATIFEWLSKVEPVINTNTINIHKILLAVTKEKEAINEPIAIETKTKKSFLGLGKEKVVAVNAEE